MFNSPVHTVTLVYALSEFVPWSTKLSVASLSFSHQPHSKAREQSRVWFKRHNQPFTPCFSTFHTILRRAIEPRRCEGVDTLRPGGAPRPGGWGAPQRTCRVHWMDLRLFLCTHTHWTSCGVPCPPGWGAPPGLWIQKTFSGWTG